MISNHSQNKKEGILIVKLPAHGAGLPGKVCHLYCPPYPRLVGGGKGDVPVKC